MRLNTQVKIARGPYAGLKGYVSAVRDQTVEISVPVFSGRVQVKLKKSEVQPVEKIPSRRSSKYSVDA